MEIFKEKKICFKYNITIIYLKTNPNKRSIYMSWKIILNDLKLEKKKESAVISEKQRKLKEDILKKENENMYMALKVAEEFCSVLALNLIKRENKIIIARSCEWARFSGFCITITPSYKRLHIELQLYEEDASSLTKRYDVLYFDSGEDDNQEQWLRDILVRLYREYYPL
jgi:hypothetical protein